jgi:hypothetical protein
MMGDQFYRHDLGQGFRNRVLWGIHLQQDDRAGLLLAFSLAWFLLASQAKLS